MKTISQKQLLRSLEIIDVVARHYGTTSEAVLSRSRSFNDGVIPARLMCVLLLRRINLKYEQIGFILNRKHHTCLHAIRQQEDYISVYKNLKIEYEGFLKILRIDVQLDLLK
jgi:chromosomal replication initiation ATPase DnaA